MAQLDTRIAHMETRLVSQMASDYKSEIRYIQGLYAALIIGVAILVAARVFT